MAKQTDIHFTVDEAIGAVTATLTLPPGAQWLFVFAHGAGAGMHHPFLRSMSEILCNHSIATFRYQFPYMEQGKRPPDRAEILQKTVRRAVETAREHAPDLSIVAGGKSMGGRMTSQAYAHASIPGVRGLIFVGFPLHPAKKPSLKRGKHLHNLSIPMIFIQGTRDTLADMNLITSTCNSLGPHAHLHVVDGADHAFHVLKRSGRTNREVQSEIGHAISKWIDEAF